MTKCRSNPESSGEESLAPACNAILALAGRYARCNSGIRQRFFTSLRSVQNDVYTVYLLPSFFMKKHLGKIIIGLAVFFIIAGFLFYKHYTRPTYPEINSPRPFKGVENAKVEIVEFSDFECPACKLATEVVKTLDAKYGYQIKIEFKYFPLVAIHPNSFLAAMAAECANDQGKFWAYHNKLFSHQDSLEKSVLLQFAEDLNLDINSFVACLDSGAKSKIVLADMTEGNNLGLTGTPTFFVNGEKVENWQLLENTVKNKLGLD